MNDWHHITQVIPKIVEIIPEAPRLYCTDPEFDDIGPEFKQYGVRCLEVVKGESFVVLRSWTENGTLWYELHLFPPREVEVMEGVRRTFPCMRLPARYVKVKEMGYLEAR